MFDFQKLVTLLQPFFSLKPTFLSQRKRKIIFIGNTGSGKSTTINYLLGCKLRRGSDDTALPADESIPFAKMGGSAQSITVYPTAYTTDSGLSLYDFPGFNDNRGEEIKVATYLCMQAAANESSSETGLAIVINYESVITERGKNLKDLAKAVGLLMKGKGYLADSIRFIINRMDVRESVNKFTLLKKKISQIIAVEKAKLESLSEVSGPLIEEKKDDFSDSSEELVNFLQLMQSASEEAFIFIDVFDTGISRDDTFNAIKEIKPVPSTVSLDFISTSPETLDFKKSLEEKMVVFNDLVKEKLELEEKQKESNQSLSQAKFHLNKCTAELLKAESYDPADVKNPNIAPLRTKIHSAQSEIDKLETEKESLNEKKGRNIAELKNLDTEEAVFYTQATETYRDHGLIYNSQIFFYDGVPYVKVAEEYYKGKITHYEYSPETGDYRSRFDSNNFSDTWASVSIYCKKNVLPKNRARIDELRKEIKSREKEILEKNQAISNLKEKILESNFKIEKAIEENQTEKETAVEAARNYKKEAQRSITELEELIREQESRAFFIKATFDQEKETLNTICSLLTLLKSKLIFNDLAGIMELFKTNYDYITSPPPSLRRFSISTNRNSLLYKPQPIEISEPTYPTKEENACCCTIS